MTNVNTDLVEDDFNYKVFKMNKGFKFDMLTDTDLAFYKKTKCEEGQKIAVVDDNNKFIFIEE